MYWQGWRPDEHRELNRYPWDSPRPIRVQDLGVGGPSRPYVRVEHGSMRIARVYDASEASHPRPEEVPIKRYGLWEGSQNAILRVSAPAYHSTVNAPVIPNLSLEPEESDSEEFDIFTPINGLVGHRNTDNDNGFTMRRQWEERVRPDSEAYPNWGSTWATEHPIAEASGSVPMRLPTEPV